MYFTKNRRKRKILSLLSIIHLRIIIRFMKDRCPGTACEAFLLRRRRTELFKAIDLFPNNAIPLREFAFQVQLDLDAGDPYETPHSKRASQVTIRLCTTIVQTLFEKKTLVSYEKDFSPTCHGELSGTAFVFSRFKKEDSEQEIIKSGTRGVFIPSVVPGLWIHTSSQNNPDALISIRVVGNGSLPPLDTAIT